MQYWIIEVSVFWFIGVETFGKHAVVCGRSKNVGMPIAMLLHADGMGE
jgi:methylenetetrahydrofolate dehydrogenase(NAD+)/5,10-methenyltetrahydrofolate cyclohydrolase